MVGVIKWRSENNNVYGNIDGFQITIELLPGGTPGYMFAIFDFVGAIVVDTTVCANWSLEEVKQKVQTWFEVKLSQKKTCKGCWIFKNFGAADRNCKCAGGYLADGAFPIEPCYKPTSEPEYCELMIEVYLKVHLADPVTCITILNNLLQRNQSVVRNMIREKRLSKGWTQKNLAERASLKESTLRSYELGNRNPKIHHLQRILKALEK